MEPDASEPTAAATSPRGVLLAFAYGAGVWAGLHILFALGGGITGEPWSSWALAFTTVAGAVLCFTAARRDRVVLLWIGLALAWFPVVVTWPAIGLGITVFAFWFLVAVTLGVAMESVRRLAAA